MADEQPLIRPTRPPGPQWRIIGLGVVCCAVLAAAGGVLAALDATAVGMVLAIIGAMLVPLVVWLGVLRAGARSQSLRVPPGAITRNSYLGFVNDLLREPPRDDPKRKADDTVRK